MHQFPTFSGQNINNFGNEHVCVCVLTGRSKRAVAWFQHQITAAGTAG